MSCFLQCSAADGDSNSIFLSSDEENEEDTTAGRGPVEGVKLEGVEEMFRVSQNQGKCRVARCKEEKMDLKFMLEGYKRKVMELEGENCNLKKQQLDLSIRKGDMIRKLKEDLEAEKVNHRREVDELREASRWRQVEIVTGIRDRVCLLKDFLVDWVTDVDEDGDGSVTTAQVWREMMKVGQELDERFGGIGFVEEAMQKFRKLLLHSEAQESSTAGSLVSPASPEYGTQENGELDGVSEDERRMFDESVPVDKEHGSENDVTPQQESLANSKLPSATGKKRVTQPYCFRRRSTKRNWSSVVTSRISARQVKGIPATSQQTRQSTKPVVCCQEGSDEQTKNFGMRRKHQMKTGSGQVHKAHSSLRCSCGVVFSCKSNLTKHIRAKTRDSAFQCTVCQKSLSSAKRLKSHMERIHRQRYTGGRSSCNICCQVFYSRKEVYHHQIKTHQRKPIERRKKE